MARRFLSLDTGMCEVRDACDAPSLNRSASGLKQVALLFLREDTLIRLGEAVSHLSISKDPIRWDLLALEHTVTAAKEGQPDSDDEDVESARPALL